MIKVYDGVDSDKVSVVRKEIHQKSIISLNSTPYTITVESKKSNPQSNPQETSIGRVIDVSRIKRTRKLIRKKVKRDRKLNH